MKVGLIGEHPNDRVAIQNLLSKQYSGITFVNLVDRLTGAMLDSKRALEDIRIEYLQKNPDLIIFIRDLDDLEKGGKSKITERYKKFNAANKMVNDVGILLLNIYELEALILADIKTFNKFYGSSLANIHDPMKVVEPKEFLKKATRDSAIRFIVTHNPDIFDKLKFDVIKNNCRYFADFIVKFEKAINV